MPFKIIKLGAREFKISLPRPNDLGSTFPKVLGREDIYKFGHAEASVRLEKEDTVVDAGAHIGLFSLLASQYVKKVVGIEAEETNCEYFRRNLELNNVENVEVVNMALASKTEERDFLISCKSPATSSFYKYYFFNDDGETAVKRKLQCTTLEDLFLAYEIDFCKVVKMNIEGAEFEVLLNLPKHMFKKVGMFIIEAHNNVTKFSYSDLVKKFNENGFDTSMVDGRGHNRTEFMTLWSLNRETE
jgi:FkbM family methyltransferase